MRVVEESYDAIIQNAMQKGIDYVTAGQLPGSTLGTKATVEGVDNVASGSYSHAEGAKTTASGSYSHAEGSNTSATCPFIEVQSFRDFILNL